MLEVVFATHNGGITLPKMLTALREMQSPPGGWRLVVVDNASTDATPDILAAARSSLPMTVLKCEQRGKSRSLNTAIPFLESDFAVFTDDDIVPGKDWLVRFKQLAQMKRNYQIFGGSIEPLWPSDPPQWILDQVPLGPAYAITPKSAKSGPTRPGMIWGPNMAVRRCVFDCGLRFDEAVGPAEGEYAMGSETDFNMRAVAAGFRCWLQPDIKVQHQIRDSQLKKEWILTRAHRYGRSLGRRSTDQEPKLLFGVPRWLLRAYCKRSFHKWASGVSVDSSRGFSHDWARAVIEGKIYQYRHVGR